MAVQPARPNAVAFGTRLSYDSLTGDRSDHLLLAVLLSSARASAGHGFPSMGCSQHCFPLRKSGHPDRVDSSSESSYPGLKKWSYWLRGPSRPPPRRCSRPLPRVPRRDPQRQRTPASRKSVSSSSGRSLSVAPSVPGAPVPYPAKSPGLRSHERPRRLHRSDVAPSRTRLPETTQKRGPGYEGSLRSPVHWLAQT